MMVAGLGSSEDWHKAVVGETGPRTEGAGHRPGNERGGRETRKRKGSEYITGTRGEEGGIYAAGQKVTRRMGQWAEAPARPHGG